jgi:hypothetical protein
MPCTLCGQERHNRRTCQRWDLLLATRLDETYRDRDRHGQNNPLTNHSPVTSEQMYERPPIHSFTASFTTPNVRHNTVNRNVTLVNTTVTVDTVETDDMVVTSQYNVISPIRPNVLFPEWDSEWDSDDDTSMFVDIQPVQVSYSTKLTACVEEPCKTDDCPICMEDLHATDLFVTRCGHQFHGTCMIRHIKLNDNCPMCRGVLFNSINV